MKGMARSHRTCPCTGRCWLDAINKAILPLEAGVHFVGVVLAHWLFGAGRCSVFSSWKYHSLTSAPCTMHHLHGVCTQCTRAGTHPADWLTPYT